MLLVRSRLASDPFPIPAPRARGRCVIGVGGDQVVVADIESRGRTNSCSVVVLGPGGATRWGTSAGPDVLERLEAKREFATGAQRFWLDAWHERVEAGGRLGQLETTLSSTGDILWRCDHQRGLIAGPDAVPARRQRAWISVEGRHAHLRATEPMSWTVDDGGSHSLWLELNGHPLCLQLDEAAAVGTLDGEIDAFGASLDPPRTDHGTLLACSGGGRIWGARLRITFKSCGSVGEGGPLSALRSCSEIEASGELDGRPVFGRGVLIERSRSCEPLEARFERAGALVGAAIQTIVPGSGNADDLRDLIGRPQGGPFMRGLDPNALQRALVAPIRLIVERGGKAWRSYLMHLCGRACGGDMTSRAGLMAVPELVHVGSLIVDDVQDGSEVRRGGPACHRIHGVALAINAGNAAYFAAELAIRQADLDPATRQWVLELLFDGFRAGHAGQALDIDGLGHEVPRAIGSSDYASLEDRVLAVQWLKSGVPAGAFARMGAVVGGGSSAPHTIVEALGAYFERVGTAFQIIDDVLNLRGFEGDLKQRGEDLSTATVTLPLVYSLARMTPDQAGATWDEIARRPTDPEQIEDLCARLEHSGGVEAAQQKAHALVEEAWGDVDRSVPDSPAKMELRALGMFLLNRHY